MLLTPRVVASPTLAVETEDTGGVVVFDSATGKRARLGKAVAALLQNSANSVDIERLAGGSNRAAVLDAVKRLTDLGFLIPEDLPRPSLNRTRMSVFPTLYRAPLLAPGQPPPDIAVLGIPYDSGNLMGAGARFGPAAVRAASVECEYRVELATGRPAGWLDMNTMERVLADVTIADWGDLAFHYGEPTETIFSRQSDLVSTMVGAGSFPLCLGGDHSVSYAAVNAVQKDAPVSVVWLDAHSDCASLASGSSHHHGNVLRRILGLRNVLGAVNLGLRGYTTFLGAQNGMPGLSIVPAGVLRRNFDAALRAVPRGERCYLSVDIDVLDPCFAPGTSTPVPNGLHFAELLDLISALARHCRIVAADVVEVNPQRDPSGITAATAYSIVTTILASVRPCGTAPARAAGARA